MWVVLGLSPRPLLLECLAKKHRTAASWQSTEHPVSLPPAAFVPAPPSLIRLISLSRLRLKP